MTKLRKAVEDASALGLVVMQQIVRQIADLPIEQIADVLAAVGKLEPVRQRAHAILNHHYKVTVLEPNSEAEMNRILNEFRVKAGFPPFDAPPTFAEALARFKRGP